MASENIDQYVKDWAEKEFYEGKSFSQIFKVDDVPLSFFIRKCFRFGMIPRFFSAYKILSYKKVPIKKKVLFSMSSLIARKALFHREINKFKKTPKNENHKKNIKKETKDSGSKRVLFLTFPYHFKDEKIFRIQTILDYMKKNSSLEPFVLFVDPLSRNEHKNLVSKNLLYSYFDPKMRSEAMELAASIAGKWASIDEESKFKMLENEKFSVWPYFKYAFNFYLSKEFLTLILIYYKTCKRMLEVENISCVVLTGTSNVIDRCLLTAAEKRNIPTLAVHHGWDRSQKAREVNSSTHVAVFGKRQAERMVKMGDKNTFHVIGPVIYDEIVPFIGKKKKHKKSKNILVVTTPFIESSRLTKKDYFTRIRSIIEQIQQIKGTKIIFKPHPRSQNLHNYKKEVEEYSFVSVADPRISREEFYKLIQWCDVFIHFGSTASIEAMIIDRPVISLNLIKGNLHGEWDKSNETIFNEYEEKTLAAAITKALLDEEPFRIARKKLVEGYFGKIDGKASQRTVELIEKIVGER